MVRVRERKQRRASSFWRLVSPTHRAGGAEVRRWADGAGRRANTDRIERKHRIEGWYLLTLLIVVLFTGILEILVEIVSARWKF